MKSNMKIALVGYGKMGQEIQKQAKLKSIEISQIIESSKELTSIAFAKDEVAIEFTAPQSCLANIEVLLSKNVPVVCGTTGWYDNIDQVRKWTQEHQGSFLYASNFSIGVHLFWNALDHLSKTINTFEQYNVFAKETHHLEKKDHPSGTAKTCDKIVTRNIDRVHKLEIDSKREGEVFGDHHVFFESPDDIIEINHKAKSRAGFALGAIECATWLVDKKGFYTIEDYLKEKF